MSIRTERHRAREIAVGTLYSLDLNGNLPPRDEDWDRFQGLNEEEIEALSVSVKVYVRFLVEGTVMNLSECDELISRFSSKRSIDMIDCVDRQILRISFFQLLHDTETHPTIIIDEAVKLSQELSNDVSFRFINGILDAYVKGLK